MSYDKLFLILTLIALGDIRLTESSSQLSCNFDSDWCGYEHNEFFERYTGKSPSISSGPFGDHTTGSEGYYALCNGKLLRDPNSKCLLYQDVNLDRDQELGFWFYMYGTMIGTLQVNLDEKILWQLSGSQKNMWYYGTVTLPAGQHKLTFSANRSIAGRLSSDLAIDDVSIEDHPLTTNIVTPTRTPASNPVQLINAEFDTKSNLEGWSSDYLNYEWLQVNGELSHSEGYYGPASDYTSISTYPKDMMSNKPLDQFCQIPFVLQDDPTKSEYYCRKAFFKNKFQCGLLPYPQAASSSQTGNCNMGYYLLMTSDKFLLSSFRSRLISPVYMLHGLRSVYFELMFAYNIFSSSGDGFDVIIEDYQDPGQFMKLGSIYGPVDVDRWHTHSMRTVVTYQQFRIIFEPIRGNDFSTEFGSISIDAIRFNKLNVTSTTITTPITTTTTKPITTTTTRPFTTTTTTEQVITTTRRPITTTTTTKEITTTTRPITTTTTTEEITTVVTEPISTTQFPEVTTEKEITYETTEVTTESNTDYSTESLVDTTTDDSVLITTSTEEDITSETTETTTESNADYSTESLVDTTTDDSVLITTSTEEDITSETTEVTTESNADYSSTLLVDTTTDNSEVTTIPTTKTTTEATDISTSSTTTTGQTTTSTVSASTSTSSTTLTVPTTTSPITTTEQVAKPEPDEGDNLWYVYFICSLFIAIAIGAGVGFFIMRKRNLTIKQVFNFNSDTFQKLKMRFEFKKNGGQKMDIDLTPI